MRFRLQISAEPVAGAALLPAIRETVPGAIVFSLQVLTASAARHFNHQTALVGSCDETFLTLLDPRAG